MTLTEMAEYIRTAPGALDISQLATLKWVVIERLAAEQTACARADERRRQEMLDLFKDHV